jgi:hypothetical protein
MYIVFLNGTKMVEAWHCCINLFEISAVHWLLENIFILLYSILYSILGFINFDRWKFIYIYLLKAQGLGVFTFFFTILYKFDGMALIFL